MERSWIAQGSALRLRPRRLREQGFLGRARLHGRDVLLRAPQGGRPGRHQSDRDLRSTPGLDREPVSGLGKGKDSNGLAVHLLSAMQGVSILAHSFHDSGLVATETKRLKSWIQSL